MKLKSALTQSKAHAKLLGVILAVLLPVFAVFPSMVLGIVTALLAATLAMEVINIVYINRKARQNPNCLEEQIK